MYEISTNNFLLLCSFITTISYLALHFLSFIWARCWDWIDDSSTRSISPLFLWIVRVMGYKPKFLYNSVYYESIKSGEILDSFWIFFLPLLFVSLLPLAIYFYEITIILVLSISVMYLARYVRRHIRVFNEHVKDEKIHKP